MATVSLGSLAVGDTVKIKESGTAYDYIVIHKGIPDATRYDSSCNGIWLMRKAVYGSKSWFSSGINDYSTSYIHSFLSTWQNRYNSAVQSLIKQVKIPYNAGSSTESGTSNHLGADGLSTKAFILSSQETGAYGSGESSLLSYFTSGDDGNTNRIAYNESGTVSNWWTRSAYGGDSSYLGTTVLYVYTDGSAKYNATSSTSQSNPIRPAMILPSNAAVVNGVITGATVDIPSGLYVGINGVARNVVNAYVGISSVKLTNLVPALSGTTGWGAGTGTLTAGGTAKYSANSLCLYGGSSNVEATAISTNKYSYVAGHKYYIRNEVYFTSGTTYKRTSCYWPIAEPNVWNSSSQGISFADATWKMMAVVSDRVAAGHTAGSDYLRFDFDNNKGGGYMHIDGIMLIDLTAAFGAGKEPSLSWCNENIPYFTGTKEIIYSGATARARKIVRGYIGVNGVARLFMDNS